jgi:hypothetical protein
MAVGVEFLGGTVETVLAIVGVELVDLAWIRGVLAVFGLRIVVGLASVAAVRRRIAVVAGRSVAGSVGTWAAGATSIRVIFLPTGKVLAD